MRTAALHAQDRDVGAGIAADQLGLGLDERAVGAGERDGRLVGRVEAGGDDEILGPGDAGAGAAAAVDADHRRGGAVDGAGERRRELREGGRAGIGRCELGHGVAPREQWGAGEERASEINRAHRTFGWGRRWLSGRRERGAPRLPSHSARSPPGFSGGGVDEGAAASHVVAHFHDAEPKSPDRPGHLRDSWPRAGRGRDRRSAAAHRAALAARAGAGRGGQRRRDRRRRGRALGRRRRRDPRAGAAARDHLRRRAGGRGGRRCDAAGAGARRRCARRRAARSGRPGHRGGARRGEERPDRDRHRAGIVAGAVDDADRAAGRSAPQGRSAS